MPINSPQALNAADRIKVRENIVYRVAGIVANFALYILGEATNTANHANRKNWADNAILNAKAVAETVSWHVLDQASFLNGGSSIDDEELKTIVEAAINNRYITPA